MGADRPPRRGKPPVHAGQAAARRLPRLPRPEVIDDGITGFIVTNVDEAVRDIARAAHLPRQKIRNVFEERFSATTMAQNYVRLYRTLLANEPRREAAA